MTVPPQLTSSLPSFSYPASFRHPPPASSFDLPESTPDSDKPSCSWDSFWIRTREWVKVAGCVTKCWESNLKVPFELLAHVQNLPKYMISDPPFAAIFVSALVHQCLLQQFWQIPSNPGSCPRCQGVSSDRPLGDVLSLRIIPFIAAVNRQFRVKCDCAKAKLDFAQICKFDNGTLLRVYPLESI